MNPVPPDKDNAPAAPDADTGLPGVRTWRAVYALVLGTFVLWVVLLSALTFLFS